MKRICPYLSQAPQGDETIWGLWLPFEMVRSENPKKEMFLRWRSCCGRFDQVEGLWFVKPHAASQRGLVSETLNGGMHLLTC